MRIGIPTEIKPLEGRVGLIPAAAGDLVSGGHQVLLQQGAGIVSGFCDHDYTKLGVRLVENATALYAEAELIVKVKEPVGTELDMLQSHHLLFSFLHLAAIPELTTKLCEIGLTAVAFETVMDHGGLPLLAPMSNIAGRIAVQAGTHYLHRSLGGKGVLLGGLGSVERGSVVVLGAGNAGGNAVHVAANLGARVTVFDKNPLKLAQMHELAPNITALYPYQEELDRAIREADLLIGAVLLPGARAPVLVTREQVAGMQPGSVIVDIAVDQGGCIETIHPTTYDNPVYMEEGVQHFAVTNMPGAVPRTASAALSAALLPYVQRLAGGDWQDDQSLVSGVNVSEGKVVLPALL
jgi:alanine dehydrogenase